MPLFKSNDFAQTSLLMALYRESDIPMRYVSGTVTVLIEKIKNWVGIEDAPMKEIMGAREIKAEKDAETIKSYLPDPPADDEAIAPDDLPDSLPAYLIDLKLHIRIDGKVKTTAGGQYVVTLDTGRISQEQLNQKQAELKETKQNLENENFDQVQSGAIAGDILHTIGLSYFAEVDMFNNLLERSHEVKATRITSAAITAANLNVSYMFDQPRIASSGGLSIDVDRDLSTVKSVNGDDENEKSYNKTSGIMGSYLEGSIFEQTFGGEAVSTMHIINHANQNGIKVYTIDQDNVDSVMPKLEYDSFKKQEFRNLIDNGKKITVPEKEVTINGWQGTGYIVENPDNGTAAYMMDG